MVEIREVTTKKQINEFVEFPIKLYKNCKYYVPALTMDEKNLFNKKKNVSYDDCDIVFYLCYKDGKVAGRIIGIVQKLYNEKVNEKRVRFTRFDCINDEEVAKALFDAVENWAKQKGMELVHGPMGFNDLDREGMLVEGFDQLATFEGQYNYDYYPKLMEKCGYQKEIDWVEFKIFPPKEELERINKLVPKVMERYKLRIVEEKNKKKFINKYKKGIFDVIDDAYGDLYGVVPYTDKVRESIIDQFNLVISMDCVITIINEKDEVVAFGLAIPSIADAVRDSKGRLFPFGLFRVLKAIKKPKVADFGLIGIRRDYRMKGVNSIIVKFIADQMKKMDLDYCETNHSLETNAPILAQWKSFEHQLHKRVRSYVKHI